MKDTDVYSAMTEGDLLALIYDKPQPICVACNDTGKNTHGGDCIPCQTRKRNQTCRK